MDKPKCLACRSENVAIVSAGLTCLDCNFSDSRIVPTDSYESQLPDSQVSWGSVPKMKQRSRIRAGEALRAFSAGKSVNQFWVELETKKDTGPMPDQQDLFNRNDYLLEEQQGDLF